MATRIAAEESLHNVLSTEVQRQQGERRLNLEERNQNMMWGWHMANIAEKEATRGDRESSKALDVLKTMYPDLTSQNDYNAVATKFFGSIKDHVSQNNGQAPDVPTMIKFASDAGKGMELETKRGANVANAQTRAEISQQRADDASRRVDQMGTMVGLATQNLQLNQAKFAETQKQSEIKNTQRERSLNIRESESNAQIAWKNAETDKINSEKGLTQAARTKYQENLGDTSLAISKIAGLRETIATNGDAMLGVSGKLKDYISRTGGQLSSPSTDPDVEEARTRLITLNEQLIKVFAANPNRPSDKSAARLQAALVSPGTWESRERAIYVLNGLEKSLQENATAYKSYLTGGVLGGGEKPKPKTGWGIEKID